MPASAHAIDGLELLAVEQPATVAELSQVVADAADAGRAIYPMGGRTMMHLGLPPQRPGIALQLGRLDAVVDYPARDMTITVEAGITIAELQAILQRKNQWLPIDVPCPSLATLGGAIACNVSGPRRFGNGGFRDYLIGITVVNAEGRETRAGGRVVKNVAGYDLCKLHVGALGTLGIITQVTLKVRPLPESTALTAVGCDSLSELVRLLDLVHDSHTRPCACAVLNGRATALLPPLADRAPKSWNVIVGFEANREAVAWQQRQLQQEMELGGFSPVHAWSDAAAEPIWRALTEFPLTGCLASFKATLLPSAVAGFCGEVERLGAAVLADAGGGMVVGLVSEVHAGEAGLSAALARLRSLAVAAQGSLVVTRCPAAWKSAIDVWGGPRSDWPLMRLIKQKLDPRGILNPGRLFQGP